MTSVADIKHAGEVMIAADIAPLAPPCYPLWPRYFRQVHELVVKQEYARIAKMWGYPRDIADDALEGLWTLYCNDD